MSRDTRTVDEVILDNFAILMERGPSLTMDYGTYAVARCPSAGAILIGGLGAMGSGQMWMAESDRHRDTPGYDDCLVVDRDEAQRLGLSEVLT